MELPNFKRVMRGYEVEAVDQAWAELQRNLTEANSSNKELRLQINSLREQNSEWGNRLKEYEKMERDLRDALLSAQRLAGKVKEEAEISANDVLTKAQAEADNLLSMSEEKAAQREADLENLLIDRQSELTLLEQRISELTAEKEALETRLDQAFTQLDILKNILNY